MRPLNELLLDENYINSSEPLNLKNYKDDELWWLNTESKQMLNRGYLLTGEYVLDAIHRICLSAVNNLPIDGEEREIMYKKFVRNVVLGWQSFSSPIWANMGTSKGLNISCFGVAPEDNMISITDKLGEVINQTKLGGGTSGYFGNLRGRGTPITDNGKSSGAVSFMGLFDKVMDTVSQGSTRRGAFAAYIDIDHPDIDEFLNIKDVGNPIQNLFFAVCVPDYWMQDMIDGDNNKREVWAKVLKARKNKGLPYIFFSDTINKNKPEIYKERKSTIYASNLCVADFTPLTYKVNEFDEEIKCDKIKDIGHNKVYVWNGKRWSLSRISKTGENKKLIKVEYVIKKYVWRKGFVETAKDYIYVTPEHKFYVQRDKKRTKIETKDLVVGDITEKWNSYDSLIKCYGEITGISEVEELYDTYCLREPKRSKVCFGSFDNMLLTGNCSEIALPSSEDESFVCCLASMNVEKYDEWKDTDAVRVATWFLDAVMEEFIRKTENLRYMEASHRFAKRHRALGIGVMGYHSYLQKNMIPFESWEAKRINVNIFKQIFEQSQAASKEMGDRFGYAPIFDEEDFAGEKFRNTTTCSVAPTTSSAAILGQASPGIEPFMSNYFKAGLAKGNFMRTNKYLKKLLQEKGLDTEEVWRSIQLNHGSVQHLEGLSEQEKNVFKTFKEISPLEIIQQAASRQKFIDQSQSLNLMIPNELELKEVNKLIIDAWKMGVKTLYYQRGVSVSKELLTKMVTCQSCES